MFHTVFATLSMIAGLAENPLSADRERIDLGSVKAGPILNAKATVRHSGTNGTLVITGVETGCGCVRTTATKLTLLPGESSEVGVEINSLTQAEGANSWRLTVHVRHDVPGSLSPSMTYSQSIVVTANLDREIVVTPPSLSMTTTGEASQSITIADRRPNGSLKITGTHSTSPFLDAAIQTNGTILVSLKSAAPSDGKTHSETITLSTSDPDYPAFRIPVTFVKRTASALNPTPERFTIRFANGETEKSAIVQLRNPGGAAIAISSATSPQPGVTVTFSKGSLPVAAVRATVDTQKAGAKGTSEILVTTSTGTSIAIPLTWGE